MAKPYELVSSEVPAARRRSASSSVYTAIVEDFLKQEAKSVLVKLDGRKTATIYVQLKAAAKQSNAAVSVLRRNDEVYLAKQ